MVGNRDRRCSSNHADEVVAASTAIAVVLVFLIPRWTRRSHLLATCTLTVLCGFVVIRAISYHNVDQLLYHRAWLGVRIGSWIEIILTGTMGAVGLASLRSSNR